MRRTTGLILFACVLLVALSGFVAEERKGLRAILVWGGPLEKPVVSAEYAAADELYAAWIDALLGPSQRYTRAQLANRPCLRIAMIMDRPEVRVSADELTPSLASFNYHFYPAWKGEPAVSQNGKVLPPDLAEGFYWYPLDSASKAVPCTADGSE